MLLGRGRAAAQNLANVAVGFAFDDPVEHLGLTRRELEKQAHGFNGGGVGYFAHDDEPVASHAVAGLLVVTRVFSPDVAGGAVLAKAPMTTGSDGVVLASDTLVSGAVVRNPGLDRYLQAHRSLTNGVVAAGGAEHRVQIVFDSK